MYRRVKRTLVRTEEGISRAKCTIPISASLAANQRRVPDVDLPYLKVGDIRKFSMLLEQKALEDNAIFDTRSEMEFFFHILPG